MPPPPMPIHSYTTVQQAMFEEIEAQYAPPFQPDVVILGDSRSADAYWPEAQWSQFGENVANLGIGGTAVQDVAWQVLSTEIDLSQVRYAINIIGVNNTEAGKALPAHVAQWIKQLCIMERGAMPLLAIPPIVVDGPPYIVRRDLQLSQALNTLATASPNKMRLASSGLSPTAPLDTNLYEDDGVHLKAAAYEPITAAVLAAIQA